MLLSYGPSVVQPNVHMQSTLRLFIGPTYGTTVVDLWSANGPFKVSVRFVPGPVMVRKWSVYVVGTVRP